MSSGAVVELHRAGCRFGGLTALQPVDLRVDAGTTCLVHGPNGSGKTTLLRVCAGLMTPTDGVRHAVGRSLYLRPGSGARRGQTVTDVLRTAWQLSGRAGLPVEQALEPARLSPFTTRRVETLSSGQRSRLVIGIALVSAPRLLCLDEPTAHLDDEGVAIIRTGVRRLTEVGSAVLVATHDRALLEQPDARLVVDGGAVRDSGCSGVR